MPNNIDTPVVPEYITVHLGLPDQPAENVRVPFVAYIKNVASSEIYPNWPESAIKMYSRMRMRMPQRVRAALTMNSAKIQESNSAVP